MKKCQIDMIHQLKEEQGRLVSLLNDGIEVDEDGISLQDTLDNLKAMMAKIKEADAHEVENALNKQEHTEDNEIANSLRKEFGTHINVRFNGSKTSESQKIVTAVTDGEYINVKTTRGSWKFLIGQDRSVDTKSGRFVVVEGMGRFTESAMEHAVGSSKDAKFDWKDFKRKEKNVIGVASRMQEIMEELHELGGNKENAEHFNYLKDLLGKMKVEHFDKTTLYIQEQAAHEASGIVAGGKKRKIGIIVSTAPKKYGNEKSEAEVFAHEVIHAMTTWAFNSGLPEVEQLKKEIEYSMRAVVKDGTTENRAMWELFLPEESIDKKKEEAEAKARYKYIFEEENALEEFLAFAATNEKFANKLKKIPLKDKKAKNWLERIVNFFEDVINAVLGNYRFTERNQNVHEHVMSIIQQLGELNTQKSMEIAERQGAAEWAMEAVVNIDDMVAEKLHNVFKKYVEDDTPIEKFPGGSKFAKAVWLTKSMKKMATNKNYKEVAGIVASTIGIHPEGFIRNILRDFMEPSEMDKAVELHGLQADRIDASRMSVIQTVKANLLEGFKKKPTKFEEESMTKVLLDTDMQSIWDDYHDKNGLGKIKRLLTDDEYLTKEIHKARTAVAELDRENKNWNLNQATGLGYFMATGKAHIAQNFNAYTIARGVLSNKYRKPKKGLVTAIDKLASLVALRYTDQLEKTTVKELIEKDYKGVLNTINLSRGFTQESKEKLFDKNSTHFIKGYSRELFDDSIAVQVAPIADKKQMEDAGFELKKELVPHSGESRKVAMGLYVSKSFQISERLRTAVKLGRPGAKGTSLKEIYASSQGEYSQIKGKMQKANLDRKRKQVVSEMEKDNFDLENMEYGMAPVIDDTGFVTDYRYMMDKESKRGLLKQDTMIGEVMARSYGTIDDKVKTVEHNKKVLKTILDDMKNNFVPGSTLGKDMATEYIMIGPDVADPKMRELFSMLPQSFKDAAYDRDDKMLAVPATLQHAYFGYKHMSIANFPGLNKITPPMIRSLIRMVEAMWIELIKIAKTNIILKMPFILVQNIVSNFVFEVFRGTDPVTAIKMYVRSFRDARSYIKAHRKVTEYEIKKAAGTITKKEAADWELLKRQMLRNPMNELMELGVYQGIIEDVETEDLRSTNKWKKIVQDKMSHLPQFVQYGADMLFLTENTKWYKINQEVLQMSDLIARDVMNRRLKEDAQKWVSGKKRLPSWWLDKHPGASKRELKDKERTAFLKEAEKQRRYELIESFVNYNKPSSRIEEYLNRVGKLMFTKYVKRIQRVIANTASKHPLGTGLDLLMESWIVDLDTIQDQSFLSKGTNMVRTYDVEDHIKNLLDFPLLKPELYRVY